MQLQINMSYPSSTLKDKINKLKRKKETAQTGRVLANTSCLLFLFHDFMIPTKIFSFEGKKKNPKFEKSYK